MTKSKNGSGKTSTRSGSANADFVQSLGQMLEKLLPIRAQLQNEIDTYKRKMLGVENERAQWIQNFVQKNAPDIESMTIVRLKKMAPGLVTPELDELLSAARNPKVPFLTWFFGGAKAYRARIRRDRLAMLHTRIAMAMLSVPRKGVLEPLNVFHNNIKSYSDDIASSTSRLTSVEAQIKSIKEAVAAYRRPGAPKPDRKLIDAVTRSNRRLRDRTISGETTRTDDTFWRDVLIIDMLTNHSYRENRRDDRDFGGLGGSFGGGGASSEYSPEPPRANEGFASTRMSGAAPRDDGRASTRMSDAAPVIVDPFRESRQTESAAETPRSESRSEGRASMRMADAAPSYPDRSESGSGTRY